MPVTPGSRLGPYEIVAALGAGGMGEVYRARDTRLGRTVAIKIVSAKLGDRPDVRQRFEREARAVAALSHAHICPLFDVGEATFTNAAGTEVLTDGPVAYLVMEYLDGESLASRLARGPLPVEQLLQYSSEIASALDAAHREGIVHRDLKPGNIVLTKTGAKLLDFGLAKRVAAAMGSAPSPWLDVVEGSGANRQIDIAGLPTVAAPMTEEGEILGTFNYMAPEQLKGKPTDARSDLFAFGALVYEMATGRRAFDGSTQASVIAAVLTHQPPFISALQPTVPPALDRLVQRCLAKDPDDRWQTAHDVTAELRWMAQGGDDSRQAKPSHERADVLPTRSPRRWPAAIALGTVAVAIVVALFVRGVGRSRPRLETGGHGLTIQSLAVLPLRNLSRDPDQDYFADGMTDALITDLSKLSASKVISRGSVMQYKDSSKPSSEIARALNVDALVEGAVMRTGNRVRISAELIDGATDRHLWAEAYERDLRDVLSLQAEVAQAISREVRGRLDDRLTGLVRPRRPIPPDAYERYLKGRYFWNKYTEGGWRQAIEYFSAAVRIDPDYAQAWAGIADSYYQLSSLVLASSDAIPKARDAAIRALAIDDTTAEAHASMGMIKAQYDWDRLGAEREFARAIELDPNYATAHQWLGMYYFADGRFPEASSSLERARQLDPLSMFIAVTATWPLASTGQYEEAIARVEAIIEIHPDVQELTDYLEELRGELYLQKGMQGDAVAHLLRGFYVKTLTDATPQDVAALGAAYARSGMSGYWRKELELAEKKYRSDADLAKRGSPERYVSPYGVAQLYARTGDRDRAFALLDVAVRNRDERLRWIKAESLRPNSPWETIRADARFGELLAHLGLVS